VELALEAHVSSHEGVKHLLEHLGPEVTSTPLPEWTSLPAPDLQGYGQLQAGGAR
jgi:hypothetical protein